MPEAEATLRCQLVIMRMKGRETILGHWCTRCMLNLVLTHYHGMEIERDDWTLCLAIMVEMWTGNIDAEWRWDQYGRYEWIWNIRGTTRQIGLRWPHIGDITSSIRSRTCRIRKHKSTLTRHSLNSSFSWCFPISSLLSLSHHVNSTIT